MRILTDCRERLVDTFPPLTAWTERKVSVLDEPEQQLWRTLTATSRAWTARLESSGLSTFWRRLVVIGQAARSQFDALHETLADGLSLDGPTAVVALGGDKFRGQRGRRWSAVKGNLFLTVGLPGGAPTARLVPGLVMLPAVAVVDAIRRHGGANSRPTIKWVNDVLVNGRKVAGVLTATLCCNGLIEAAVLGVGVNVVRAPNIEPTPFAPAAGCLADAGITVTLGRFMWDVLDRLADRYRALFEDGPADLLQAYREASCVVGRRVRIWEESADRFETKEVWPTPIAAGVVQSIEQDLSLRIDGRREPVGRGRLALDEVCAAMGR